MRQERLIAFGQGQNQVVELIDAENPVGDIRVDVGVSGLFEGVSEEWPKKDDGYACAEPHFGTCRRTRDTKKAVTRLAQDLLKRGCHQETADGSDGKSRSRDPTREGGCLRGDSRRRDGV